MLSLAYQMHQESNFRNLEFSAPMYAERVAGYAASQDYLTLLIENEGQDIGVLIAYVTRADFGPALIAYDKGLFVTPTRRGTLAARKLIQQYTDWAREKGASRICFDVRTGVNPNRTAAFFEKCGYKNIGHCLIYQE